MAGIALVAVPFSLAWLFNSIWLGRTQEKLAMAESGRLRAETPAVV
jgi:hypothetical protein